MLHIKLPSSITKVTPLLNKALVGVGCGVAVGFGVGVGVMVSPLIDAVYPLHKSGVGCGDCTSSSVYQYINTVSSLPYSFTLPSEYSYYVTYGVKVIDNNNCVYCTFFTYNTISINIINFITILNIIYC